MRTKSTRVSPSRLPTFSASTAESLSSGCEYSSRQSSLCETQPGVNKSSQVKSSTLSLLWLWCCRDKLCIDQDNINRALRCLPVFVFSCNRLMILAGNTYCDRLWCVWELYTFFSTSGTRALKRVELYDFSDAGTSTLLEFDVANAHCFSPVDEAKLRSIIESGGASNFNDMIREGVCV